MLKTSIYSPEIVERVRDGRMKCIMSRTLKRSRDNSFTLTDVITIQRALARIEGETEYISKCEGFTDKKFWYHSCICGGFLKVASL